LPGPGDNPDNEKSAVSIEFNQHIKGHSKVRQKKRSGKGFPDPGIKPAEMIYRGHIIVIVKIIERKAEATRDATNDHGFIQT
jgi:hypothetical protein